MQGQECIVRFLYQSYTGASTEILGGANPFVLREFNTDENWFKPVRPLMAEIQIVTDGSGVTIDDFLQDTDSEIKVHFDFGSWTNYWIGYIMQDDFQEICMMWRKAMESLGHKFPFSDLPQEEQTKGWDIVKKQLGKTNG